MIKAFGALARMRRLRGTPFDIFGYSEERRLERRLLADYQDDLALILRLVSPAKIEAAAALASVPALIRGFGHVKHANAAKAAEERKRLIKRINAPVEEVTLQAAE
jgi:indolepyruvate ferredoxin oxidoreductase